MRTVPKRGAVVAWWVIASVAVGAAFVAGCHPEGGEPRHQVAGADADRGKALTKSLGCGTCHTIPGVGGANGVVGPPLTDFGRRGYIAGEVANTPPNLIRWIESPQSIEPHTAMPNLGIDARDARDIAAYLYTLR